LATADLFKTNNFPLLRLELGELAGVLDPKLAPKFDLAACD